MLHLVIVQAVRSFFCLKRMTFFHINAMQKLLFLLQQKSMLIFESLVTTFPGV